VAATSLPPGAHSIKARRKRVAAASGGKKKQPKGSATLTHVHETVESVASVELTPPHPPRVETPRYAATHKLLVFDKDTPCHVCKVRRSDLMDPARAKDPTINKYAARDLETHHFPCERSLLDAVDWRKVHERFPSVYSQESLEMWVDSPENMLVLCDYCHRSPEGGIHHLLTQDFAIRPFLLDGYQVAATAKDVATALASDERIEQATGIEQAVDQQIAAATSVDVGSVPGVGISAPGDANSAPPRTPSKRKRVRKSKVAVPVATSVKVALA
jgi:hypothetical protein